MWFCLTNGFVSVVEDRDDASLLLIRARRKKDLVNVLGGNAEIFEDSEAEYRWRSFIGREAFKAIVSRRIDAIDYPNFKDSVVEDELHDLYMEFWRLHRSYQKSDPQPPL